MWLFFVLIFILGVLLYILYLNQRPIFQYHKKPLLNDEMLHFFQQLKKDYPGFHIAPSVSVKALLQTTGEHKRQAYFHIASQKVDFVIFDATGSVQTIVMNARTMNEKKEHYCTLLKSAGYNVHSMNI